MSDITTFALNAERMTPDLVEEARAWLMDCEWANVDADDIAELPAATIVRAVERHYDGGLSNFLRANAACVGCDVSFAGATRVVRAASGCPVHAS